MCLLQARALSDEARVALAHAVEDVHGDKESQVHPVVVHVGTGRDVDGHNCHIDQRLGADDDAKCPRVRHREDVHVGATVQ